MTNRIDPYKFQVSFYFMQKSHLFLIKDCQMLSFLFYERLFLGAVQTAGAVVYPSNFMAGRKEKERGFDGAMKGCFRPLSLFHFTSRSPSPIRGMNSLQFPSSSQSFSYCIFLFPHLSHKHFISSNYVIQRRLRKEQDWARCMDITTATTKKMSEACRAAKNSYAVDWATSSFSPLVLVWLIRPLT
jgi:hypothetical protein